MEGTKKIKTTLSNQYSWNSEVETTWISLIGWPHKTSIIYLIDYLILASSEEASFSPGSPRQRKLARNENNFETQLGKTRKESVKFKETEHQAMIQNKLLTVRFGKTLLLGLVMNFPWLLSFVKVFSKNTSDYIWYPFVIFHGFQVFFF